MSLQSLDIKRLSATTTPAPQARTPQSGDVAKLIDVSKCIGCKACQTACMEWNDLRDEIGTLAAGVYDNPTDLTDQSWTVMRFAEYENEATGNLDTRTSFEILVLFQKLHAEGRTIIFVTHNPEIAQYSSRNIVLRDGQVKDDKPNRNILNAAETLAALPKQEDD